jgi:hypothetical protein
MHEQIFGFANVKVYVSKKVLYHFNVYYCKVAALLHPKKLLEHLPRVGEKILFYTVGHNNINWF